MLLQSLFQVFLYSTLILMGSPKITFENHVSLIPRKVIFGNPDKMLPLISMDGMMIAYLAPNKEGVMNIWVKSVGKNDDRVVTIDQKRGIRFLAWQGDGKHILYTQDKGGDENWHLYQTNIQNGRTRDLTPFEGVQTKTIAKDSINFPNERVIGLNKDDRRFHDAYHLDLVEGSLKLVAENPGDVRHFVADNNLKVRAALAAMPDGSSVVRVRDTEDSKWRDLISWGVEDQDGAILAFNPSNTALWIKTSVGANTSRVLEVDLKTGKQVILFENPSYDVNQIETHPSEHKIQAATYFGEYLEWSVIDASFKRDYDFLRNYKKGDLKILSRDKKDQRWTVAYIMDDLPAEYFLYNRTNKKMVHLFSYKEALKQYTLAKTTPISFKARDGMQIYGYLTLPPKKEERVPTVVLVHGGPWARDNWHYHPIKQWLANRGYAVLQINYRGSSGYGMDYLNAGKGEWANKMHTDLIDGKKWAVEEGFADPNNIAVMGASFGGYATLVALTFTPNAFKCGLSMVGPSNLLTLIKKIPDYWYLQRALFKIFVGDPEKDIALLKSRSPFFKVDRIKKPLFVAHGANDPRVAQAESDQIVEAMRDRNLPVEYLIFPDEGHGFVRPINRLKCFAAAEKFLAKHLTGRLEPASEDEDWQDVSH